MPEYVGSPIGHSGGSVDLGITGSGGYDIIDHTASVVLSAADANKLHRMTSGTAKTVALWESTSATKGYRFGMHKMDVGAVDVNAFAGQNIAGNNDIENTTADPDAIMWLYDNGDGSFSRDGVGRGLWI
ncbi:MAG: hypothetical protein KAS32_10965 [Candidatus Peribacteraceae bacterium]|nr:hypothetical protein [Candidatus Peribacteraceae bacterium]